ncbi:MAG: copper homeostasis protein CutC [Bacteroidetes bacterium]|nr:copper homeostasis protein CutC [Bacteroidota bacterium]
MNKKLEIACFNLESALIAEENGADRIELCENYKEGGLFPNEVLIKEVLTKTTIPVFVMIRPRSGNFIYSPDEVEIMKQQIHLCKKLNCDGIVFGVMNEDGSINTAVCKQLVKLAEPLSCTFHRAFDQVNDYSKALEQIIDCRFKRILTSGVNTNAITGKNILRELIQKAEDRIIIMPGGGIRSSHVCELAEFTEAKEFHSAAIINENETANAEEIKKLKSNLN